MNICALLPLKTTGSRESRSLAFAGNLLRTLDAFWTGTSPLKIFIVVPDEERRSVARVLRSTSRLAIEVLPESTLLPNPAQYTDLPGWFRQMLVKVGFASFATTFCYLTFDADVICCRPFDENTFVREGKLVTEWEPTYWHPEWWQHAAAALGQPEYPPGNVVAVTPNLFAREIMLAAQEFLGRASDVPWDVRLATMSDIQHYQWSEQSIYTIAGMASGLFEKLHWMAPPQDDWPALHAPIHIWRREDCALENYGPADWIRERDRGHFVVVQSTTGYDPADVMAKFEPLLATGPHANEEKPQKSFLQRLGSWAQKRPS